MIGQEGPFNTLFAVVEKIAPEALVAAAVLFGAWLVSRVMQRLIDRRLRHDGHSDEEAIRFYKKVTRFFCLATGIVLALHAFGINMSTFFTTGGLFAVAMAFAMKNLSENLVSGIILRLERSVKPGDVVEANGRMVRVSKIGFRATLAKTKDEKDLVIPNANLVQSEVANHTFRDSLCRIVASVAVAYSSDIGKVRKTLEGVCEGFDWTSSLKEPKVRLSALDASAMRFQVQIWIDDPWQSGGRKSEINEAIVRGLKEAEIAIAFPQIDVHLDQGKGGASS